MNWDPMLQRSARERWYALHRARRCFRQHFRHTLEVFLTHFPSVDLMPAPAQHLFESTLDSIINPPLVYDPKLPNGGFPPMPKWRPKLP